MPGKEAWVFPGRPAALGEATGALQLWATGICSGKKEWGEGTKVQACLLFILFKLLFDLESALPSARGCEE